MAPGESVEVLICNFFLSFYNIKTLSLLALTMDGKKEKEEEREKGKKRQQREGENIEKK